MIHVIFIGSCLIAIIVTLFQHTLISLWFMSSSIYDIYAMTFLIAKLPWKTKALTAAKKSGGQLQEMELDLEQRTKGIKRVVGYVGIFIGEWKLRHTISIKHNSS